jgi:hypothetical protein
MRFHTQTEINPGNCWQTALACILDEEAEALPPQAEIEGWKWGDNGSASYWNIIRTYLLTHHGLVYYEVCSYARACVRPRRNEWLLIGETIRTGRHRINRGRHILHCIVAYDGGARTWDVHPSRDGLTTVERLGAVGDAQAETLRQHEEQVEKNKALFDDENNTSFLQDVCLCPAHYLEQARTRIARLLLATPKLKTT